MGEDKEVWSADVRIIVAGTDLTLLDQLESELTSHGYRVGKAVSIADLLRQLLHYQPSLVIVVSDHTSLTWNAREACQRVREVSQALIMGIAYETGVIAMLRDGADDCVRWPVGWEEFMARIVALLRRTARRGPSKNSPAILVEAGLWINFDTQEVNVRGMDVVFTNKEFGLLSQLMRNSGHVVTHAQLLAAMSSKSGKIRSESVRQCIYCLRRKIERDPSDPQAIVTHRGIGYSFDAHGL